MLLITSVYVTLYASGLLPTESKSRLWLLSVFQGAVPLLKI